MKVAILAGGSGIRLREETTFKPKAMVEIGSQPILWHIMKYYHHFGFHEFVIALGYKGEQVRHWFQDRAEMHATEWSAQLIDTGQETLTGGRIKRLGPYLGTGTFMLNWCDTLSNVNLNSLLKFHRSHRRLATLTAAERASKYGHLKLRGDEVVEFEEKPKAWINGAFFVLEPGVLEYIDGDDIVWEREPLERLARDQQLMAYRHNGFWQSMETVSDKVILDAHWKTGKAPWKLWT